MYTRGVNFFSNVSQTHTVLSGSVPVDYGNAVITTVSFPDGNVDVLYNQTAQVSGGLAPYTWSLTSGSLPPGLALTGSTGVIYGVPTNSQSYSFELTVNDSNTPTSSDTQQFSVFVSGSVGVPLSITTTTFPLSQVGAVYSETTQATGGATPYTWSVSAGSLPSGLALTASNGTLYGVPTTVQTGSFTLQVTDSLSATDTQAYNLIVSAAAALEIQTTTIANATSGSATSRTFTAIGGLTPYSWSLDSGSLPGGTFLTSSTGDIVGTPSATGSYSFNLKVSDSQGTPFTDTQSYSWTITDPDTPWLVETWDYADRATMVSQPHLAPKRYAAENGEERPVTIQSGTPSGSVATSGPWGTNKALETWFDPQMSASQQPQVGMSLYLPSVTATELWIDMWVAWDDHWTTGPDWENPPGFPTGNRDDKTIFFYPQGLSPRWELKIVESTYGNVTIGGKSHFPWDPPLAFPSSDYWGDFNSHSNAYPSGGVNGNVLWDATFRNFKFHLKADSGAGDAVYEAWMDGNKIVNMHNVELSSSEGAGANQPFYSIEHGANRNSGPDYGMSRYFGPTKVYTGSAPPGWPT